MSSYDRVLINTPLNRYRVAELVASAADGSVLDHRDDGDPVVALPSGMFAFISDGEFWSGVHECGSITTDVFVQDPDRDPAAQAAAARAIFEGLKRATSYHLVLLTDDGETFVDSRRALASDDS